MLWSIIKNTSNLMADTLSYYLAIGASAMAGVALRIRNKPIKSPREVLVELPVVAVMSLIAAGISSYMQYDLQVACAISSVLTWAGPAAIYAVAEQKFGVNLRGEPKSGNGSTESSNESGPS